MIADPRAAAAGGIRDPEAGEPDDGDRSLRRAPRYERIYAIVRRIPEGHVATYGQIAAIEGHSGARQVGYALSALADDSVPWQRVINHRGEVSARSSGDGNLVQRDLLALEGVEFDLAGRVDLARYGWRGPEWEWLERHGFEPAPRPGRCETP